MYGIDRAIKDPRYLRLNYEFNKMMKKGRIAHSLTKSPDE